MAVNGRRISRSERIVIAGLFMCVLAVCLYRLEIYPAAWFDEGIVLQVPKNLVLYGRYAIMRRPDGLQKFDPAIQTGPMILLPIALIFHLAGTGVLQARLVMVCYTILALAFFYELVRDVWGRRVALLASLLLVFTFDSKFTSFLYMGRQVLAEVPALAFFWLGTLLWFRAWESPRWSTLVGSGVLWGLAMLTKAQFILILPAAGVVFWLLDRLTTKELKTRQTLLPLLISGLCLSVWYGYQILSLGMADFSRQSTALGSAGLLHFLSFSPRRVLSSLFQLVGSQLFLLGLPGVLYTIALGLRRSERNNHRQVFLVIFTLAWLVWYAFLSIGWSRYAFVPATMGTAFTAHLLVDLWNWAGEGRQIGAHKSGLAPGQLAVGAMIVMLLLSGALFLVRDIVRAPTSGLQEFARYLNTNISKDAVIESWEWEVDLLTDHAYHHPSYEVTNAFTESLWYGTPVPSHLYDVEAAAPDYLVQGPFARWTGIYTRDVLEYCSLVVVIGEYELYRFGD